MKKFKLSIMTAIAITGIMATNATAVTIGVSNNNVALVTQIIKSKNIDKMVSRINTLYGYAEQYMLLTGHIPSSINDIKSKFVLSNASVANFSGSSLNISVNTSNYKITVGHLFNNNIDSNTLSLVEHSSALAPTASINENKSGEMYNPSITYPMSPNIINFVTKIKAVKSNSNNYISVNAPSDVSKTWYKPTGNGNFYIYKFIDGQWKNAGNLSASGIVVNSADKLTQYNSEAKTGTKAYVKDGDALKEYVFDGNSWVKVQTGGGSSNVNSYTGIINSNGSYWSLFTSNFAPGSTITIPDGTNWKKQILADDPTIWYWVKLNSDNQPDYKSIAITMDNLKKAYEEGLLNLINSNNFDKIFIYDNYNGENYIFYINNDGHIKYIVLLNHNNKLNIIYNVADLSGQFLSVPSNSKEIYFATNTLIKMAKLFGNDKETWEKMYKNGSFYDVTFNEGNPSFIFYGNKADMTIEKNYNMIKIVNDVYTDAKYQHTQYFFNSITGLKNYINDGNEGNFLNKNNSIYLYNQSKQVYAKITDVDNNIVCADTNETACEGFSLSGLTPTITSFTGITGTGAYAFLYNYKPDWSGYLPNKFVEYNGEVFYNVDDNHLYWYGIKNHNDQLLFDKVNGKYVPKVFNFHLKVYKDGNAVDYCSGSGCPSNLDVPNPPSWPN